MTNDREAGEGRQPIRASSGLHWVAQGWRTFRRAPGTWVALTVVWALLSLFVQMVPIAGGVVLGVLSPVLMGGVMLACRDLERGQPLRVASLFGGFRERTGDLAALGMIFVAGSTLILLSLVLLAVAVAGAGALVAAIHAPDALLAALGPTWLLGLVLLAALGYALLAMGMWFAPAAVVLGRRGPWRAFVASMKTSTRFWVPLLVKGLTLGMLAVLVVLTFGLGLVVFTPVATASIYHSYRDLFDDADPGVGGERAGRVQPGVIRGG